VATGKLKRSAKRKVHIGKDTILSEHGEILAEYHRFREQATKTIYVTMYLDDENLYETYKGLGSLGMVWGYIMKKYDHESGIFYFSQSIKDDIMEVTGLSIGTVRSSVKSYTENNLLIRVVGAEYMVNPNYFYKGTWEKRAAMIELYDKLKAVLDSREASKVLDKKTVKI
jgi:hypothetical protein